MTTLRLQLNTRTQAEALYWYFESQVVKNEPTDIADSLILDLMIKIHRRLRTKVENHSTKGWVLVLPSEEAKAYHIYFQKMAPQPSHVQATLLINAHVAEIDKVYA